MSPSDYAAWWGAGLATGAIIWDVIKWRKARTRIKIEIIPNIGRFYPNSNMDETAKILVKIINGGEQTTTVMKVELISYQSRFESIFRKSKNQQIAPAKDCPQELLPGRILDFTVETYLSDLYQPSAHIFVSVHHSTSTKPVLAKLSLPPCA